MRHMQQTMAKVLRAAATAASNTTTSVQVDTVQSGIKYMSANIKVFQHAASATNSADKMLVLNVSEGDAADTNYTAIAAFTGTTNSVATSGFVIQTNTNTAIGGFTEFNIDCRARKRYLTVVFEPSDVTHRVSVVATLSDPIEATPDTATERGSLITVTG